MSAILNLRTPMCVGDIRHFLGMTNLLGKFSRHLADKTKPLRDLLSSKNQWCWEEPQQKTLVDVKEEISKNPVLTLFGPGQETIVSADASSYGLGAVLLQKQAIGEKRLDELLIRVQRFCMQMMRYTFSISHVLGKSLVMADALSRALVSQRIRSPRKSDPG